MGGERRGRGLGSERVRFRRRVEVPSLRGRDGWVVEGRMEVSGGRGSCGVGEMRCVRMRACWRFGGFLACWPVLGGFFLVREDRGGKGGRGLLWLGRRTCRRGNRTWRRGCSLCG